MWYTTCNMCLSADYVWLNGLVGSALAILGFLVAVSACRRVVVGKRLLAKGMRAQATITSKYNVGSSQSGPTYCVDYQFARAGKNGQSRTFEGTARDYSDYHRTSVGDAVEVLYMAFDPQINMITDDAKQAAGSIDFTRNCPKLVGVVCLIAVGFAAGFVEPLSALDCQTGIPYNQCWQSTGGIISAVLFVVVFIGFLVIWFFDLRKRFPNRCGLGGKGSASNQGDSNPAPVMVGADA